MATADTSVRDYLALEEKYQRVIALVLQGADVNVDDIRRELDDIFNAGRDKGRPVTSVRRPLSYEVSDNIVLVMGGGTSEKGAREHTNRLVNAAKAEGRKEALAEGRRLALAEVRARLADMEA